MLPQIDFARVSAMAGDLSALIGRDLGWNSSGGKFRCPFHEGGAERTPSLMVYDDHYHRFACSAHGDAVSWIAHRDHLTMVQAAKVIDPMLETPQGRQARSSVAST
jgi:DNA primase